MGWCVMPELVEFTVDLTGWEQQRVATVLTAAGDQLDLHTMYWDECDAHRILYTGLSPEQWAIYDHLTAAGVLNDH